MFRRAGNWTQEQLFRFWWWSRKFLRGPDPSFETTHVCAATQWWNYFKTLHTNISFSIFWYFSRRSQNYINILRFLNLGDKKLNPFDITHRFTHLFWLGDLNYRIDFPSTVSFTGSFSHFVRFVFKSSCGHAGCQMFEHLHCFPSQEAEYIVTKIKQQQYQELLSKDQLSMEKKDGKVFLHFGEHLKKYWSLLRKTAYLCVIRFSKSTLCCSDAFTYCQHILKIKG